MQNDRPRLRPILRAANFLFDRLKLVRNRAGSQNIATVFCKAEEDFPNLSRAFAMGENHFRHAHPQRAVMVHLGEAEVFKRQMTELADTLVGSNFAAAYALENVADRFGVQSVLTFAALD